MEKIAETPEKERLGFLNKIDNTKQRETGKKIDFPAPKVKNSNDFQYKWN
ncbi:hypothetical protein AALB16_06700 [Lachnospiraceae bacterium 62-35]